MFAYRELPVKMWLLMGVLCGLLAASNAASESQREKNMDPASRQLLDFKLHHKVPIGLFSLSFGKPVEIRETVGLNTDLLTNPLHLESQLHLEHENIPERVVHTKGAGAFGYFEVTHDVSHYTKANVFNGYGKRTPVAVRFSPVVQNTGGSDLERETRGFATKFYTEDGILDLIGLHVPVFMNKDPNDFPNFVHAFKRNPRTNLFDFNARYDFITLRPDSFHFFLYLLSDFGIPKNYRQMNGYMQHAFEIYNKHGDRYIVRFDWHTEQGLANYTTEESVVLKGLDPDLFVRDLYNAIERKEHPSWKLYMEVIPFKNLSKLNFDPFDMTRLWPEDSYEKVPIGRLVLTENPKNYHAQVEQLAYSPSHLVPGIVGAPDPIFANRLRSYPSTLQHRLGVNFNKIKVNRPDYQKNYNRKGQPPVLDDGKDAPNYYPNSFKGPIPFVDHGRPNKRLVVIQSHAVDLKPAAHFYNKVLKSEPERLRLVENLVVTLSLVYDKIQDRTIEILTQIDKDLGTRVRVGVEAARLLQSVVTTPQPPQSEKVDKDKESKEASSDKPEAKEEEKKTDTDKDPSSGKIEKS